MGELNRAVVDFLYNNSTTNRSNGVWAIVSVTRPIVAVYSFATVDEALCNNSVETIVAINFTSTDQRQKRLF